MNAASWVAVLMGVAVVFFLVLAGAAHRKKDK